MKSFRTFLIPAGMALALAIPVAGIAQTAPVAPGAAQTGGRHHHHGGFMHAMRNLNLSADQQSRIKAIVTQFHQAHPKGSAPDKTAREAMKQQVMSVLTPAQQAQFKAEAANARSGNEPNENGANAANGAHQGGRMMQRFEALNLSDQQKAQIQTIIQQFRQAHPRGSARDPQAMAAMRAQINAVLTPQQQQQLQQMRGHDGDGQQPSGQPPLR